ncbi:MAG: hypothetical protein NC251_12675 [Lachnoclostridium sp.]|nr:hypothetical protein [Lachnospira sp.]MCM1249268.1 hypothetical protein [Lachnoclostridium sp.]
MTITIRQSENSFLTENILHLFGYHEQVPALDEQGITEDLKTVLTPEELAEIKSSDVEEMYQKWYAVIVDRYIMFSEKHPFRKIKKDAHKNVMEVVRTIIKMLKG